MGSQAVDGPRFVTLHWRMASAKIGLGGGEIKVVGSFGDPLNLRAASDASVRALCDVAEIRLDLLQREAAQVEPGWWAHLADTPLLFTARRIEEGGALELDAAARINLLRPALDYAACIDIEVASISEMAGFLAELAARQIPWIASYHDFDRLPATAGLVHAAEQARSAGAAVFKAAAKLNSVTDLARLAEFQLTEHGLPVATMGMGPLAPVSRLLCAQCGSVLNYGYIGDSPTAPGQWDSALLKTAISRLEPFRA